MAPILHIKTINNISIKTLYKKVLSKSGSNVYSESKKCVINILSIFIYNIIILSLFKYFL